MPGWDSVCSATSPPDCRRSGTMSEPSATTTSGPGSPCGGISDRPRSQDVSGVGFRRRPSVAPGDRGRSLSAIGHHGEVPARPDSDGADALSSTDRTTLRRKKERGSYDRDMVNAILDEGLLCHVGFSVDG